MTSILSNIIKYLIMVAIELLNPSRMEEMRKWPKMLKGLEITFSILIGSLLFYVDAIMACGFGPLPETVPSTYKLKWDLVIWLPIISVSILLIPMYLFEKEQKSLSDKSLV